MSVKHNIEQLYSDLKYKHGKLQDTLAIIKTENNNLKVKNNKLLIANNQLKQQLETQHDDVVHKLPKKSVDGNFVSLKKYNKQVKLTEHFIDLYHSVKPPKRLDL